jgi:hypothetical protein
VVPPKKRGRKPNALNAEPAASVTLEGTQAKRGPGRPAGASKKKAAPIDPVGLSQQVMGVHLMIAQLTGIPEFAINEMEASMLGASIAAVCDEYDLSLNGKTGVFIQLLATASIIYIPRVPKIRERLHSMRAPNQGQIFDAPHTPHD